MYTPPILPAPTFEVGSLFRIHFALRNPPRGRGNGEHGVADIEVVEEYARILERAYTVLRDSKYGWPELSHLPIDVYVYGVPRGVSGYAFPALFGNAPFLGLASGGAEPHVNGARQKRQAAAVHELTHLFQFELEPSPGWRWFDEATATAMEAEVMSENIDYYRYLEPWFTHPERCPCLGSGYGATTMVRYLMRRIDHRIAVQAYERGRASGWNLSAIDALGEAALGKGIEVGSPAEGDIFAAGYSRDSYFLRDSVSTFSRERLYLRFGDRSVAETFVDYPLEREVPENSIGELACRYYRFRPERGKSRLTVRIELATAQARPSLCGELISVMPDMGAGDSVAFSQPAGTCEAMVATLGGFEEARVDHAVLVLTNSDRSVGAGNSCGFRISAWTE